MPESGSLMAYVGSFIAVTIMLGVGTLILGGATTDCSNVSGYDSIIPASSTGWAAQCLSNAEQAQAGYALLMITLIVIAAVVVLSVVRMLG